jgi:hypothetical protein
MSGRLGIEPRMTRIDTNLDSALPRFRVTGAACLRPPTGGTRRRQSGRACKQACRGDQIVSCCLALRGWHATLVESRPPESRDTRGVLRWIRPVLSYSCQFVSFVGGLLRGLCASSEGRTDGPERVVRNWCDNGMNGRNRVYAG